MLKPVEDPLLLDPAKPFSSWLYTVEGAKEILLHPHKAETAAIRRAKEDAPYPPGGCFGDPEVSAGETRVKELVAGELVLRRTFRRKPFSTRDGLRLKVAEISEVVA